jgi:hypothetical protein
MVSPTSKKIIQPRRLQYFLITFVGTSETLVLRGDIYSMFQMGVG